MKKRREVIDLTGVSPGDSRKTILYLLACVSSSKPGKAAIFCQIYLTNGMLYLVASLPQN